MIFINIINEVCQNFIKNSDFFTRSYFGFALS